MTTDGLKDGSVSDELSNVGASRTESNSILVLRMIAAGKLEQEQLPVVSELLPEADLRRVITGDGHRLERPEEVPAMRLRDPGCPRLTAS